MGFQVWGNGTRWLGVQRRDTRRAGGHPLADHVGSGDITGVIAQDLLAGGYITGKGRAAGVDGFFTVEVFGPLEARNWGNSLEAQAGRPCEAPLDVDEHIDPLLGGNEFLHLL